MRYPYFNSTENGKKLCDMYLQNILNLGKDNTPSSFKIYTHLVYIVKTVRVYSVHLPTPQSPTAKMKLVDSTPCAFLVCMSIICTNILWNLLTWSIESTTVTWINKYAGHNSKDLILLHNPVLKCCKLKTIECSHTYLKCLIYSGCTATVTWQCPGNPFRKWRLWRRQQESWHY